MDELVTQLGVGGIFAVLLLREAKGIIANGIDKKKNGNATAPNATHEQIYQKTKAVREHQQTVCAVNLNKIDDTLERLAAVAEKQVDLQTKLAGKQDRTLDRLASIEAAVNK